MIFVNLCLRSECQMPLSTERHIADVMIGHVMQVEASAAGRLCAPQLSVRTIPEYLQRYYWWAYIHPNAVRLFERQWLVNAILLGNLARLRDAVLDELGRRFVDGLNRPGFVGGSRS